MITTAKPKRAKIDERAEIPGAKRPERKTRAEREANGRAGKQPADLDPVGSATPDGIAAHDPDAAPLAEDPAAVVDGGQLVELDPAWCDPSPFQPRREFPAAELEALAASLARLGQLQPGIVRAVGERYELIAGERRCRAATIAGRSFWARIVRLNDAEAAEAVLVENLHRADLNPIEQARGFARLLALRGCTQQQLADALRITQGQVSNRLRLLEAPDAWQARVISGEMPASHLREILPYVAHAALSDALAQAWREQHARDGEAPPLADWRGMAHEIIREHTGALQERRWDATASSTIDVTVAPDEDQRAALAIVNVPAVVRYERGGKPVYGDEPRAVNREAWQPLYEAAVEQARAKARKKLARARGQRDEAVEPAAGEDGKADPAEVRRARAERDRRLTEAVAAWRVDWLRYLVAQQVGATDGKAAQVVRRRLMGWLICRHDHRVDRSEWLVDALRRVARKVDRQRWWAGLAGATAAQVDAALAEVAARALWDPHEQRPTPAERGGIPADVVEDLAAELGIELKREWEKLAGKQRQALGGPLTRRLFELHDREQLEALADEQGLATFGLKTKTALVEALLGANERGKLLGLPKCLAAKRKRKGG